MKLDVKREESQANYKKLDAFAIGGNCSLVKEIQAKLHPQDQWFFGCQRVEQQQLQVLRSQLSSPSSSLGPSRVMLLALIGP